VDVCNAVAYAHSRGVLHRDLKPGNIMLGKYGETLLVDWGLAKPLGHATSTADVAEPPLVPRSGEGSSATVHGRALGTPAYMSPEQAAGRLDRLGPATDIYSLGATLYELLTGRVPFPGGDLDAVQKGLFPPPRSMSRGVPRALEAVCLKAMAIKPEDRNRLASALAADVEHWLADEPVTAWREPWGLRARRWIKQHQIVVTGSAVLLLTAVTALSISTVLLSKSNRREQEQKNLARRNYDIAQGALYTTLRSIETAPELQRDEFVPLRKRLLDNLCEYVEDSTANDPTGRVNLFGGRSYLQFARQMRFLSPKPDVIATYEKAIGQANSVEGTGRLATDRDLYLTMCYESMGVFLRDTGDLKRAYESFQRCEPVYDRLAREGTIPDHQVKYFRTRLLTRMGEVSQAGGDSSRAVRHFSDALSLLGVERPMWYERGILTEILLGRAIALRALGRDDESLSDRQRARNSHPDNDQVWYEIEYAQALFRSRDLAAAAAAAESTAQAAQLKIDDFLEAAGVLVLVNSAIRYDESRPLAQRQEEADRMAGRAVALLRDGMSRLNRFREFDAAGEGVTYADYLRGSESLRALQVRDDFRTLLKDAAGRRPVTDAGAPPPPK
jgi:tetratricopeptide (TPR) repeat protein